MTTTSDKTRYAICLQHSMATATNIGMLAMSVASLAKSPSVVVYTCPCSARIAYLGAPILILAAAKYYYNTSKTPNTQKRRTLTGQ